MRHDFIYSPHLHFVTWKSWLYMRIYDAYPLNGFGYLIKTMHHHDHRHHHHTWFIYTRVANIVQESI